MKKLFISILMCAAVMSAKAQVLTSETVNNVYETVINQTDGDVFKAERTGNKITTMYVYKKNSNRKGMITLKPYAKYQYQYTANGMLSRKVTFRWIEGQGDWACTARFDYKLNNGIYSAEYSRYNHAEDRFDQPVDKMVYALSGDDSVNYISHYRRNQPLARYELVSETSVAGAPVLFAVK